MTDLEKEMAVAKAALPPHYFLVKEGLVKAEDLVWDFSNSTWSQVTAPRPFQPGQKRPGFLQMTEIGKNVEKFLAIARKQT